MLWFALNQACLAHTAKNLSIGRSGHLDLGAGNLAARKLEPSVQASHSPRRLLRCEADVWVAEVRKAMLVKLPNGPVQL
jgi:hypothetical protein